MHGTTTTVENLTQALTLYLRSESGSNSEALREGPLLRSETVREKHWHWLKGWHASDGSTQRPSEEWAESALVVIESWPHQDGTSTDRRVGRSLLQQLACEVAPTPEGFQETDGAITSLKHLWIATNAWGAGTNDTRRPAATAKSLLPETLETIKKAARLIPEGPEVLPAAYDLHEDLNGFNEAYWTKFLWALSLADSYTHPVRPLILDARLRSTTHELRGEDDWRKTRGSGKRYRAFCSTLKETAGHLVELGFDHIDSEKVEYLLFERDGPNFSNWLHQRLMQSLHTN